MNKRDEQRMFDFCFVAKAYCSHEVAARSNDSTIATAMV
jgi:hypothetical protein